MKNLVPCSACGSLHPAEALTEFDGQLLCSSCLHTETTRCQRCGQRIWSDSNAGDEDTHLCQSCFDRFYTTCEDCGRVIHQDDAYYDDDDDDPRCYACHCNHTGSREIHDYYYKPEPEFFGQGSRYFGVELEIDGAGEDNSNARQILRLVNDGEERAYCKHDGSLDEGFEIVSHPMTLDYHCRHMPWKEVLDKARSLGYRSHQAGTCGLHVHVNRTAFGNTLGLRWSSIDLQGGWIHIDTTVVKEKIGNNVVTTVRENTTKTEYSRRDLPLCPYTHQYFLNLRNQQLRQMQICGASYDQRYLDFVCVDQMGTILQPDYVSQKFQQLLQKYELRPIRFHDLRHSCATIMLYLGYTMKDIQTWLGHSNYAFTANTYVHASHEEHQRMAEALSEKLPELMPKM